MSISVLVRKERFETPFLATVEDVLRYLGFPPEMYLVLLDGELVDASHPLKDGDTLQLIGVISGG